MLDIANFMALIILIRVSFHGISEYKYHVSFPTIPLVIAMKQCASRSSSETQQVEEQANRALAENVAIAFQKNIVSSTASVV
jgi:hypothetical protein